MAPPQDTWYLEITLHLISDFLSRDSSTFSSTSSLSRSNTIFDTGLSTMLFLPAWSTLLIFNLTLTQTLSHQNMFAWLYTSASHSWWCRNSFLQRYQNWFTICWTRLHLLQLYKSGLKKSPGGGKIIFDFMVKRFDGERGKLLVRSLMLSVVKGREFKIPCLCH